MIDLYFILFLLIALFLVIGIVLLVLRIKYLLNVPKYLEDISVSLRLISELIYEQNNT